MLITIRRTTKTTSHAISRFCASQILITTIHQFPPDSLLMFALPKIYLAIDLFQTVSRIIIPSLHDRHAHGKRHGLPFYQPR